MTNEYAISLINNLRIVNTSPHSTTFDGNQVAEGNPELAKLMTLDSKSYVVDVSLGVELMMFQMELSDSCKEQLTLLSKLCDLILVPAIFSAVNKDDFPTCCKRKVVAYLATEETKRSKPQDKIACSKQFSLIY